MSQEVFEIVKEMNLKDIETQLVLQCAPLITRLKMSNLLNIQNENVGKVIAILMNTDISYFVLLQTSHRTTLLLYQENSLKEYLLNEKAKRLLRRLGYQESDLNKALPIFQKRFYDYRKNGGKFPHEMGLFLGYPVEDVEGFIINGGQNFLYTGYWKVYENLIDKVGLFQKFEKAKENLIQLIYNGVSIENIIDKYSDNKLQKVAV